MGSNELPFSQLCCGLAVLLEACDWARGSGIDLWQFAVRLDCLRQAGFSDTHLSWLLYSGHLEHAREFTPPCDHQRSFRSVGKLNFGKRSCFALSDPGISWARSICQKYGVPAPICSDRPAELDQSSNYDVIPAPYWERERRRLTWKSDVLLELSARAQNLSRILDAFQEENWLPQIDDPLPAARGVDAKRRLRGAIEKLNESVRLPRIRFSGDGSGEAVCWKLATRNGHPAR